MYLTTFVFYILSFMGFNLDNCQPTTFDFYGHQANGYYCPTPSISPTRSR